MSARRLLARCTLALLLPVSLIVGSESTSANDEVDTPAASVSVRATAAQRIRLEALPQIVQQGGRVADAGAARSALTATIRPVRAGRRIQLQVRQGLAWVLVTTVRQDGKGRAQFAAAATADGHPLTYRVRALAVQDLRTLTSAPVSTERWLDPTFTDEFSGTELAPVWNHRGREHWSTSRRTCSKGDPRAVRVGGGAVRLSVIA